MKPLKIIMSAFGSYGKVTAVDFQEVDHGLFLITGDTGSGKTTIFDAISFALFGELSGGLRDGSMMRSQYAGEEETYVELTFSDLGQIYTVRRSPSYQRMSKRKNKDGGRTVTTVSAKASLIMPDGREIPGRIGEINEKLQEIVGVDRNQFAQIAMIAQGEYIKLLHASSKDRKEIFARIFDTGIYGRIQQRLKEKNAELYGKLMDNRKLCDHEAAQVAMPESEPNLKVRWLWAMEHFGTRPDELLEVLSLIVKESRRLDLSVRAELENLLQSISSQNLRLVQAEEKNRRLDGLEAARLQLSELKSEKEVRRRQRKLCERAERAILAASEEAVYQKAEREHRETKGRIEALKKELEELKAPLLKAAKVRSDKESRLELERPELTARISRITELLPVYQTFEAQQAEASLCRRRLDKLVEEKEKREAAAALRQTAREKLERQQSELECSAALLSESTVRLGRMEERNRGFSRLIGDLDRLRRCHGEKEEKRAQVGLRQAAYEQAASDYEEKNRRFIQVQAGILALNLGEGIPCPVCGSLDHPNKASLMPGEVTKAQVESAGQAKEKADQAMREALNAYQEQSAEYSALSGQVQSEYERLTGQRGETCTQLQKETESLAAQCREACHSEELRNKTLAGQEKAWRENRLTLNRLEAEEETDQRYLRENQEAVIQARLSLQQAELQAKALRKSLFWETKSQAEEERQKSEERLTLLEREAREAAEHLQYLQETMTQKGGYLASEQEKEVSLKQEKEELYGRWLDRLRKQGFSGEEEYRQAIMPEETLREQKEAADRYDDNLLKAETAYEQYRKITEGETREPEEEIQAALALLTKKKEQLTAESSRRSGVRTRDEAAYKNLQKLIKERETLRERKQLVETLYTTADGKMSGSARIDFQTYIQRRYFKQMVAAANKRLFPMTGGQFLLQCRDMEILGRQGEVGLDLDVYNPASDRIRDVKTLSGGESFLAALSLALGMADVIQNTAGRINIEAMFIDEGFGSLDEESRVKAIAVLKELAGGSRLVGIISHVTELKEQLDRKLLVTKSEAGSTVSWKLET